MKASILAVGTELTTGQITNANAAWISSRLKAHGLLTTLHLTVPDDRSLIRDSLKLCAEKSDLIFVTGGLGPTSDDFTRDLIAEWAGQNLIFDPVSWKKVEERLTSRGFPVHDFQKQQCFFPNGSQILDNSQGTANAFYLESPKPLWVLPGPPREVEAVWNDHIDTKIKELTRHLDFHITHSWDTLGLGENQVAKIVEPLIENSGLEVGYRVHLPYVEFKLSFFKSQQKKADPYLVAVDKALSPFTVTRDGNDVALLLGKKLESAPHLIVQDFVTNGILLKRLQPALKNLLNRSAFTYTQTSLSLEPTAWKLKLTPVDDFKCQLTGIKDGKEFGLILEAPWKAPSMADRRKSFWTELALVETLKSWT